MAKRTTHRSSKGTKLYAVRDKKGKFKDIQSYKRAHSADLGKRGARRDRLKKSESLGFVLAAVIIACLVALVALATLR